MRPLKIGLYGSNFNNFVLVVPKMMHSGPSVHISINDLIEYADVSIFKHMDNAKMTFFHTWNANSSISPKLPYLPQSLIPPNEP